ncbi:hypothetical protein ARMGADRAFT_1062984 [Armillaria gallica]|uniref:Uncharacterized protein n=1 Tax=Armillaria gallica TaxID=47427 RepID=A0A2H3DEF5_ARMGA|nr:hypothetical protein ARMGADRAFT_1062984 [Armillaria gallica]
MPVVREDGLKGGLDEEDQKRYHYVPSAKGTNAANAIGTIDIDHNENEYTRLRVREEDENDDVHLRIRYLFDEDKAMTPLCLMLAKKNLLTEAQRIAYVGPCSLTSREMAQELKTVRRKELKAGVASMELWAMKIMGWLYYHMEFETQEQKMIESLGEHGVLPMDLVPALMTTHTVANPEYDPEAARQQKHHEDELEVQPVTHDDPAFPTTAKVLKDTSTSAIPGVSTILSSADERVTLDIRWTVLCDLFLILIADSVYDARSRVLLESVALKLGLGWLDVVKFESRVTEALEIQEDVERIENEDIIDDSIPKNSGYSPHAVVPVMFNLAILKDAIGVYLSNFGIPLETALIAELKSQSGAARCGTIRYRDGFLYYKGLSTATIADLRN